MKIDSEDILIAVIIAMVLGMFVLFTGKPDLHDALLYKLSDGKIPIPVIEKP